MDGSPDRRDIYYAKYYGKGKWPLGEKNQELGEKIKRGKEKKEENYIKN